MKITGANVTLSSEELVATLLDPRAVSCQHLTPDLRKRAMRLYVDKYATFAATAVRQNYVSHSLLPSPTKAKPSINEDSTIIGGFKLESGVSSSDNDLTPVQKVSLEEHYEKEAARVFRSWRKQRIE